MIRTSSIGDIIFSLPIVLALKKTFPKSEITWLVDERYRELVINDQLIDKVIQWPKENWTALISRKNFFEFIVEFYLFIKKLRKIQYDLVIDLQGLLRTNIFTRFSCATKRVSLGSEFCGFLFADRILIRDHSSRRISSEYFKLAKVLDLKDDNFFPRFNISKQYHKRVLAKFNFEKKTNFFVIAPFTTRPEKHWINSRWNSLVESLIEKYQLKCIVLGKANNYEQEMLIDILKNKAESYVGRTTLMEAAEIINLSKFLIGVDTGLTHMSVSLKKKTIALFGATCPYLDPVFPSTKVIWINNKYNSFIGQSNHKSTTSCINEIYPETVLKELENLYQVN